MLITIDISSVILRQAWNHTWTLQVSVIMVKGLYEWQNEEFDYFE